MYKYFFILQLDLIKFSYTRLSNFQEMSHIVDQQPDIVADASDDSDDELKVKNRFVKYDVEASKLDSSGLFYKDSDSELEMDSDSEDEKEKDSLGIFVY